MNELSQMNQAKEEKREGNVSNEIIFGSDAFQNTYESSSLGKFE